MVLEMDDSRAQQDANGRVTHLRKRLCEQGRVVVSLVEAAFKAFYDRDAADAAGVSAEDDRVDRADVEIEKECVALLTSAAHGDYRLDQDQVRSVLTVVKINNELERVADVGAEIADLVGKLADPDTRFPETTEVMTNSVLGVARDTVGAIEKSDPDLARVVLQSEHVVLAFKGEILRKAERRVAEGSMSVDSAFDLHELVSHCILIADHCSNIAEQVIYERTGMIVRHMEERWVERPASDS
ncbi:MAG: hypothetical protein D6695_06050 [Planctomycetota bacterium]|nr:MAG: hypothetical protein D6695_06050 [Planctomycetota bacterium]